MPDPLLKATARYRCLSTLLVCGAAPCECHAARYRARGSVHCPFCGSETPSLELDLRGAELRARCKDGCNEDSVRGLVDGDDTPLLALYGSSLSGEHARLLLESAIAPCVAKARSYWTASKAAQMERLGFARTQRNVPALIIPIHNVHGDLATYQARPDRPRVRDGKALKYETVAGARMTLDVPPGVRAMLGDPRRPLLITEGSRKADSAVSDGLCCIALLGVWNWRGTNQWGGKTALPDWEVIAFKDARGAGREVFIAFDSDVMLKPPVYLALSRLKPFLESRGAIVRVIYLASGEGGAKVGLDDYLAAGHTVDDLLRLARDELLPPPDGGADDAGGGTEAETQADALVRIGLGAELFHDPLGEPYARATLDGHRECWPLRSKAFRHWLVGTYYKEKGMAPNAEAVASARNLLEACALFDGPCEPAHVRVAPDGAEGLYIDLGDPQWRAVRVTRDGWVVVDDPPVNFVRSAGTLVLPEPIPGGTLDDLRAFVNVADDDAWALFKAFLRGCLRARGPYPVLALAGEQGTAKSTAARMARALVDPRTPDLRSEPRDARDLAIAARGSWVVAFDNVSRIDQWLSDALCRLATGGGFATRELYTDFDEALFDAQRPVVLTGITDYVTRPDLLDRTVQVVLAPIPEDRRRDEAGLWAAFEAARPCLLGALLDDVVAAMRELPDIRLGRLPRMADFAIWAVAAERGRAEPPAFLQAYTRARDMTHEQALEGSPIGGVLLKLIGGDLARGPWEGTAAELLARLSDLAGEAATRAKDWPRSPRGLSGELRRLAPALRGVGLTVVIGERSGHDRRRLIRLASPDAARADGAAGDPSASSAPAAPATAQEARPHGTADGHPPAADGSATDADGWTGDRPGDADGADDQAASVSVGMRGAAAEDWDEV